MSSPVIAAAPAKLKDRASILSAIVMVLLSAPLYFARFLGGLESGAAPAALWSVSIVYGALAILGSYILYLARPDPSRSWAGLALHLLLAVVLALAIVALSFLSGGGF